MKRLLWMTIFLVGCGSSKKEPTFPTKNAIDDLIAQKQFYLIEMAKAQDEHGFIEADSCDSLLFSGLAFASGLDVDITAAEGEPGQWFRTPSHDCYGNGAGSDISRDMLIGLMWGLWSRDRRDQLAELYEFGKKKNWVMGGGPLDRTLFTSNMINTLRAALDNGERFAEIWIDPLKDHQRHVVALNIILRAEIENRVSEEALHILKVFTEQQPGNALFQYGLARFTSGDQQPVIEILRNPQFFPKDRLPLSSDRCSRWMWERDLDGDDTPPCDQGKTHSGGDFTFMVWLMEQSRG